MLFPVKWNKEVGPWPPAQPIGSPPGRTLSVAPAGVLRRVRRGQHRVRLQAQAGGVQPEARCTVLRMSHAHAARGVQVETGVRSDRQKLVGLKRLKGGLPKDEDLVSDLQPLRPGSKLLLIG